MLKPNSTRSVLNLHEATKRNVHWINYTKKADYSKKLLFILYWYLLSVLIFTEIKQLVSQQLF